MADPLPTGGGRQQAQTEGACLQWWHTDFLLYQAAASGGKALRYLMIPRLIESLRELGPADDILQVFLLANKRIRAELKQLDPGSVLRQLPKFEVTLEKKLCIGNEFPPLKQSQTQTDSKISSGQSKQAVASSPQQSASQVQVVI